MTDIRSTFAERLRELVEWARPDDVIANGRINHNRLADDIERRFAETTGYKISQPTLTRILNGHVTEGSPRVVKVLAAYFRVDPSVVRGESPIPERVSIADSQRDGDDEMSTYLDDVERARKQLGRLKQPALGHVIQLIDTMIALQDERYRTWADDQAETLRTKYAETPPPAAPSNKKRR